MHCSMKVVVEGEVDGNDCDSVGDYGRNSDNSTAKERGRDKL